MTMFIIFKQDDKVKTRVDFFGIVFADHMDQACDMIHKELVGQQKMSVLVVEWDDVVCFNLNAVRVKPDAMVTRMSVK